MFAYLHRFLATTELVDWIGWCLACALLCLKDVIQPPTAVSLPNCSQLGGVVTFPGDGSQGRGRDIACQMSCSPEAIPRLLLYTILQVFSEGISPTHDLTAMISELVTFCDS